MHTIIIMNNIVIYGMFTDLTAVISSHYLNCIIGCNGCTHKKCLVIAVDAYYNYEYCYLWHVSLTWLL